VDGNGTSHIDVQPQTGTLFVSGGNLVILAAGLAIFFLLLARLRARRSAKQRAPEVARTDRIRADEQLRAQAMLARSTNELRQFASFISHELRQPLASMRIWVELLGTTRKEVPEDRRQKYVKEITEAIRRMTEVLDTQLRFVQDTTSDAVSDEAVDLTELLRVLVASVEGELSRAGAAITVDGLATTQGDARQLRRLFRNLIENALTYRRPDVPLHVTIRGSVDEGDERRAASYQIRVEDNGRGFAPELADEIFRMFRRAETTSTRAGVGLAVCRRIVEHHGGTIRAEGSPGSGATFVISLPMARCETRPALVGSRP
jgi:signal transduction histidine kinase